MKRTLVMSANLIFVVLFLLWMSAFPLAAENIIKIGVMGPMKFGAGIETMQGAEIAAEEINEKGGINVNGVGYKIVLIKADTNEYLSVIDAVNTIERLIIIEKVNFLIGGHRSEATLAQMDVMADHKKLLLGIMSTSPKLCERVAEDYNRYKYFFRFGSLNSIHLGNVGYAMMGHIKAKIIEKMEIEKIRVALQFEKAVWADAVIEDARDKLPKFGMEVVRVGRHSATATDVTSELAAIQSARAHIIFSGGAGPCETTLGKQWGELRTPALLVSLSTPVMEKRHWKATGGACEYQATHTPIGRVEITPKTIPFYDKFEKRTNEFPTAGGGVPSYEAINVLKGAIERAKSMDSDKLVEEMEKTDYIGPYGRYQFFPRGHKWTHDVVWGPQNITQCGVQWIKGRLETFWPDGRPVWGDEKWKGVKYKGSIDYQFPPWYLDYWKGKK